MTNEKTFTEHGPEPWPPVAKTSEVACWCGAKCGEACFVMPGPDGKRRRDGTFARRTRPHRQRSRRVSSGASTISSCRAHTRRVLPTDGVLT